MTSPLKLGFMASRNGTSARAIVAAIEDGALEADPRLLVSNNSKAQALDFARSRAIACQCIPTRSEPEAADTALCAAMRSAGVEIIVLSGYLRRLGPVTLQAFSGRVVNIHPGPLPAFGGEGMYGRRVHEAVIASRATASGIAVHLVDGEYDRGPILAQCAVPVLAGDTAETLEARVTALEPAFYVATLRKIAAGELRLDGLRR